MNTSRYRSKNTTKQAFMYESMTPDISCYANSTLCMAKKMRYFFGKRK